MSQICTKQLYLPVFTVVLANPPQPYFHTSCWTTLPDIALYKLLAECLQYVPATKPHHHVPQANALLYGVCSLAGMRQPASMVARSAGHATPSTLAAWLPQPHMHQPPGCFRGRPQDEAVQRLQHCALLQQGLPNCRVAAPQAAVQAGGCCRGCRWRHHIMTRYTTQVADESKAS